MPIDHFNIQGLNDQEVNTSRAKHGNNLLVYKKTNRYWEVFKHLAQDPMILLLLVASAIYFITGHTSDGVFLASAIVLESVVSMYQDSRSRNALEKLKTFTQARCKVIRNNDVQEINTADVVIGDSLLLEEGGAIAADGTIVHSNDFSVNESILTGESLSLSKDKNSKDNQTFRGTTVVSGLAVVTVTAIGNETKLGKIGKSLDDIKEEKTPLENQINHFVKRMVIAGAIVFVLFWGINFYLSKDALESLLRSLTLAMSILPEEIPVAFTTFMALGAFRLMKMGIVVKQMKTVETLGSASVICTDKTGTITENKMTLAKLFVLESNKISSPGDVLSDSDKNLITLSMWASEQMPFDPMEISLHTEYAKIATVDERPNFKMVHEYPLEGKPPMMTHIFGNAAGQKIIAAKGAPEALINSCKLSDSDKQNINTAITTLSSEGYRILAVAEAPYTNDNFPEKQQDIAFVFKGLVAFYDPPKHNIQAVLQGFYNAGIAVKIITGDNAATTTAIAKQIGFKGYENSISGEDLMYLSDVDFKKKVSQTNLFVRMFPEAKLRIINALKDSKEIVAMTGDGVNDGPALKAAHIGIAMGKKGSEIAKQAASLILLEDDLSKMVEAVGTGRKIYANIKKAIQYIISIHIPIILTVFIPLALGWIYPNIFSPIHVIFLELIMGPTCSILFENEPMEKNTMNQKPRAMSIAFFSRNELSTSIVQGLVITLGVLLIYQYGVRQGLNEALVRTLVFTVLLTANIFLTLINRSFYYSILTTLKYKNALVPIIISITVVLSGLILYVPPVTRFFQFEHLSGIQLLLAIAVGFLSVIWYEGVKVWKRRG